MTCVVVCLVVNALSLVFGWVLSTVGIEWVATSSHLQFVECNKTNASPLYRLDAVWISSIRGRREEKVELATTYRMAMHIEEPRETTQG